MTLLPFTKLTRTILAELMTAVCVINWTVIQNISYALSNITLMCKFFLLHLLFAYLLRKLITLIITPTRTQR